MATVKLTIFKAGSIAGGNRTDVPSAWNASAVRATGTMTSGAGNKRFNTAADIAEATGISLNAGETGYLHSNGGAVKVAFSVAANGDATSTYHMILEDGMTQAIYAGENDTRVAVADV